MNSARTAGKTVSDVLPISEAQLEFKRLRLEKKSPAGPDFPRLVLSLVSLDLQHRFPNSTEVGPLDGAPWKTPESEPVDESEPVPIQRPARRRNAGDGQE